MNEPLEFRGLFFGKEIGVQGRLLMISFVLKGSIAVRKHMLLIVR